MKVIAVIPARGGSKGIPRKNLRPLAGRPLIEYAIRACVDCSSVDRVVVSTDDDEIALFAARFGAEVSMRPTELAGDAVTLDPVVVQAVEAVEASSGERFDIIVTVQPTSPLVTAADIDGVVGIVAEGAADTVLTVVDDRHLTWRAEGERFVPEYAARVNRQQLPPRFRETGAVVACTREQLQSGSRFGARVLPSVMPAERSIDIDDSRDLAFCEFLMLRRRIVFVVVGNAELGLGHAYRAITLAHDLVKHQIEFVCPAGSELARDHIAARNYQVAMMPLDEVAGWVRATGTDIVVNDILDTGADYVHALRAGGTRVVNFEDLGPGTQHADLVVNALYPGAPPHPHCLVGHDYFCLRDEFLHITPRQRGGEPANLLVTFGGVDEGNLTQRALELLLPLCSERGMRMQLVLGPGYAHRGSLERRVAELGSPLVTLVSATMRISDYMNAADIAVTSGGRTVYELVSLGVPTVVICQNAREQTHTFAKPEYGICNLGHRATATDAAILQAVERLAGDAGWYREMLERMSRINLRSGRARVIAAIEALFSDSHGV